MLALEFITWWYGRGWVLQAHNAQTRLNRTIHLFSLPILFRTLFAPWKRITTDPGAGLEAHFRAAADNLVSRLVGFSVRLLVLFSAGIIFFFVAVISFTEVIIWPFLPPATVLALIKGVL